MKRQSQKSVATTGKREEVVHTLMVLFAGILSCIGAGAPDGSRSVYGEYQKNITSPFALLNVRMCDPAFDARTYEHTRIGFEADSKAMPRGWSTANRSFGWHWMRRAV